MIKGAGEIIKILNENGYLAYLVGGCVRDIIMNNTPYDYDITTNATPEDIMRIFPHTAPTGLKHGTVTVIINDFTYEVTTFRIDGAYEDNRHPENVTFSQELKDDIKRRDFTVNSIAYSEKEGFIDYFNGIKDIENKIIRTVNNPFDRFTEDALRILRGIRFSSRFGFDIEENTFIAMKELMHLIRNISGERIFDELSKMFEKNPYKASLLLKATLFFEVSGFRINENNIAKLENIEQKNFEVVFSILTEGIDEYEDFLNSLRPSNKVKTTIKKIKGSLNYTLKTKTDLKLLLYEFSCEDIIYHIIDTRKALGFKDGNLSLLYDEIKANNECFLLKDLKLNGSDLLKLGIKGEEIKKTLDYLVRKVIEDNSLNERDRLIKINAGSTQVPQDSF